MGPRVRIRLAPAESYANHWFLPALFAGWLGGCRSGCWHPARISSGGSRPRVTVLSCCGRFDKARCPFSAIAVCRRCSPSFEKRRQRRFGPRGRPLQDPVGSGSERIELVKLLYAFSTRRLRWVRKHGSPGATRHSIDGLDVYASRPRATAAMRRRFHGATGGATRRRVFCASMADVFDNKGPTSWRVDLWSLTGSPGRVVSLAQRVEPVPPRLTRW